MNEQNREARIQELGLNAPRLTSADIDHTIVDQQYYRFPNTTTIVCCLTLRNGSNVIGEFACASAANFNEEIGKERAFEKARQKIWELEGYLLRNNLNYQQANVKV